VEHWACKEMLFDAASYALDAASYVSINGMPMAENFQPFKA
jgi:hypothetical protein